MSNDILVVDDDPGVLHTVKYGLEGADQDFNVETVESGKKCLEYLDNNTPDIILLDIMMPDMTGWETYNKIKNNMSWRKIPVVFLTARTDSIARNAGDFLAEDYIEKPFKIPELIDRINLILNK